MGLSSQSRQRIILNRKVLPSYEPSLNLVHLTSVYAKFFPIKNILPHWVVGDEVRPAQPSGE
jgi:hypothetical protein